MLQKKTYCFDIDGTLCTNTFGDYKNAKPIKERIELINKLFFEGNRIKLLTARGSSTGVDWRELTELQLKTWKVNYHSLDFGKIDADIFIDDKAYNSNYFFNIYSEIHVNNHIEVLVKTLNEEARQKIKFASNLISKAFQKKRKVLLAGNGGSFSDCLHMSSELTGRFLKQRDSYPSIVLGSNGSSMSAIANDFGFEFSFSRELNAFGNKGDIFIGLSTSGKSKNILNCFREAKNKGLKTIFLTGNKYENDISDLDVTLKVKSSNTAIIQQIHIVILHLICIDIEKEI